MVKEAIKLGTLTGTVHEDVPISFIDGSLTVDNACGATAHLLNVLFAYMTPEDRVKFCGTLIASIFEATTRP